MPRSNRPRRGGRRTAPAGAVPAADADRAGAAGRVEEHQDGTWAVRPVSGPRAVKTYRCPGCDQEIPPGTPHLVVWSADGAIGAFGDVSDRRHWHTPCWSARLRRPPRR